MAIHHGWLEKVALALTMYCIRTSEAGEDRGERKTWSAGWGTLARCRFSEHALCHPVWVTDTLRIQQQLSEIRILLKLL